MTTALSISLTPPLAGPPLLSPLRPRLYAPCRHCKRNAGKKPRGLCYTCYGNLSIRLCYPSFRPGACRGHGLNGTYRGQACEGYIPLPLPPTPTTALPGTAEKQVVMEARLAAGYHLHHPLDAVWQEGCLTTHSSSRHGANPCVDFYQ